MKIPESWSVPVVAGALSLAASIAFVVPVSAAMWLRISVDPPTPQVGQNTRVTVLTFSLTENRCWDDPAASPIPSSVWHTSSGEKLQLELRALHPGSPEVVVPLV